MSASELRDTFLVDGLFQPSELRMVLTDMDRLAIGGIMPAESIPLGTYPDMKTGFFTERRELGIINLGEPAHVSVGRDNYSLGTYDCLYIGSGNPDIRFAPCGSSKPRLYFLSCPAHRAFPTVRVRKDEASTEVIGATKDASRRRLLKYIHPDGAASCQLVMGLTQLEPGSVWNTMPPHTHGRRSEVYLYAGLGEGLVMHLMGEPTQTRHLLVRDYQAVLSPCWSIHTGAGTTPYSFVWGMAGENQSFSDMDPVDLHQLR